MNIVFLSIFICGVNFLSNALPISMLHDQSRMQTPHLLQKLKENPSQFIYEMSQVDPAEVTKIINLLKDLLQTSESKETELIEKLNTAEAALGVASNDVIDAEDDLHKAEGDQTSAENALSDFKAVREHKLAAKNAAQETHDDEIESLNDEQNVLTTVIELLQRLINDDGVKYYWAVGPIASTEVSDNVCGSDGILAMPKTKMEQQRLLDELPNLESGGAYEGSYAWLGGKFDVSSNSWKWNDGSPIGLPGTGETNWAQGEGLPENGEAQPLFGLIRPSGLWHDFHGLNAEVDEGQIAICQHAEVVENGVNMLKMVSTNQDFVQKGRHLLSSNALSVLKMFKKNSTSFISEMSKADPGAVKKIIAMLKELKETSEARENHLISELDQAIHELGEASNDVVKAEGALEAAVAAVAATTQDLAVKQMTQIEKQAIKDSAQETLDDELPGLDEEQDVITTVIGKLEELK